MPAKIVEILFDKETISNPPTAETYLESAETDGVLTLLSRVSNGDEGLGIDLHRYRLGSEAADLRRAPDGEYVLVVNKQGNAADAVVSFDIKAVGSDVVVARAEFPLLDYFKSSLVKNSAGMQEPQEDNGGNSHNLSVHFLEKILSPLIDMKKSLYDFMATSLVKSLACDLVLISASLYIAELEARGRQQGGPTGRDGPRPSR